jgi:hypothetical protein
MSVQERYTLTLHSAVVAAGTSEVFPCIIAESGTWKLEAAAFVAGTAITSDDTNFSDLSIDIGGTEVSSEQTTTGDLGSIAASGIAVLDITGTGTDLEVTGGVAGTVVEFKKTDSGSGVAVDGTWCASFVKLRS